MRNATLAFLVAVFTSVVPASAQDTTLRYRWITGDEARYRIIQQSSVTLSGLPGIGDMTMDVSMAQVVRMAVQDVAADGSATLRETFESVRIEQSSPMGKTLFDSASPEKPADQSSVTLGSVMSAMIGESVTIVIGPDGATGKVEGMSALIDKTLKTLPPGPAAAFAADQIKGLLSDDAIRNIVGQGMAIFPDRPLKTGETWSSQIDQANPVLGNMSIARTFTLTAVENRNGVSLAHIAVRLAIKQVGPAPLAIPGMSISANSSESVGEIVFDATIGRLLHTSLKGETPMEMSLTPAGGEPIHVKGLTRSLVTMELVEN
jgi:Family of unknown function (DUF6263)